MAALPFLPLCLSALRPFGGMLLLVFCGACGPSASEEESKPPESSPSEPQRHAPGSAQTGDGDDPTEPDESDAIDESDLGDFSEYRETCGDSPCASGSECRETRSGEACLTPCPGQPCPPGEGWTSYCDPQGGVTCLQEGEW